MGQKEVIQLDSVRRLAKHLRDEVANVDAWNLESKEAALSYNNARKLSIELELMIDEARAWELSEQRSRQNEWVSRTE